MSGDGGHRALDRLRQSAGRRVRAVQRHLSGSFGAFALLYHRVAEAEADPWGLCVRPDHFAEHLDVLRRHARPMPLTAFADALQRGRLPRNAVTITFDDGYADNLHAAKPLLECADVPATVFLATGYAGHGRSFWWDELERVLLQAGPLPDVLDVPVGGAKHRRALGEAAEPWQAEGGPGEARYALFHGLWRELAGLQGGERRAVLGRLQEWSGTPSGSPAPRALDRAEVAELVKGGLIEVGAHTVTHPMLSDLPVAVQRDEVSQSKADLEGWLGGPVSTFSYPHGRFNADTVQAVRDAGYAAACCSAPYAVAANVAWRRPDPLCLPRISVGDWTGAKFEAKLLSGFEA